MKFLKMNRKSKNAIAFILILLSCHCITNAQESVSISLQEAWQRANTFSKELQLRKIDTKISEEKILDAKNKWLPEFGADASYGKLANIPIFENGILKSPEYIPLEDHSVYDAGIEAYFNLYNGHKTKIRVKQAETKQTLLHYLEEAGFSDIHYKVAQDYLGIQASLAFKNLIERNIYKNNERLNQITKLYQNGVVLKSDLLRSQLQLSRQKTNLLKIENNLELSTQQLNILIGFNDDQAIEPTDSIAIGSEYIKTELLYQDYLGQAIQLSPLEKIARAQITMMQLYEKDVKAEKLPKIGFFGEYTYSYPQIKLYPYSNSPYLMGVAGIKVSYNISALYHDKHKERAASISIRKQELAQKQTEDQLRIDVRTAYKRFHENLKEIETAKMNIQQAEENYRIVNQTYFNQLALLTDLLTADTQLLQAKFELVNSQVSAKLHYYQLLKITGQL